MGDIMRTILLSIKPEVYDRIFLGNKKYEYRKRISKESVKAYLYVSKPIQEIKGILYLGERCNLTENDMAEFAEGNKYKMKILGYQETTSISLEKIKKYNGNFVIPQGFYYLDNTPIGKYIADTAIEIGIVHKNEF